jgi:hypothetical protein
MANTRATHLNHLAQVTNSSLKPISSLATKTRLDANDSKRRTKSPKRLAASGVEEAAFLKRDISAVMVARDVTVDVGM